MDGRRCTWCGAENAGEAATCSSCGARFAPAEPQPAISGGWSPRVDPTSPAPPIPPAPPTPGSPLPPAPAAGPGSWSRMPSPDWTPIAPSTPSPGPKKALIAVGVVVALVVAGLVVKTVLFRPAIGFPDQLAGLSRNDSKVAKGIQDFVENLADGYGFRVHVGIYGMNDFQPELMVIAFERGDAPPTAFQDFASGFTSSSGETVGEPADQRRGEVDYRCASVSSTSSAAASAQALCEWTDPDTGGFIVTMNPTDPSAAIDLAAQVHDAVVN